MLKYFSAIMTFISPVVCPAYIFWQAYMDFEPTSFLWWCEVSLGLVVLFTFTFDLEHFFNDFSKYASYSKGDLKK